MFVYKMAYTKNIFFLTITSVLCLTFATALAQQAISTPILTSAANFRDIAGIPTSSGGTGFANTTSNFGVMRTGIYYRSSVLSLSNADWNTLSSLHIVRDIDLRTPQEISTTPDIVPAGAMYTTINVFGTPSPPSLIPANPTIASLLRAGQNGYRTFATDPVERAGFRTVLLTLAHDSGPDLFHCSDGKDRTGWTAVLLESIAGVSPTTIMSDYLASDTYLASLLNAAAARLAAATGLRAADLIPILGVNSTYLQAALDQVIASYGSMQAYLMQGLGLSQADIYVLRAKMVYYTRLPGQGVFAGNAASGTAMLNALQNSPLSGTYTNYNYYLQAAVDAGTLGGVEGQVGGQVHADAAAYLLRQPQWIDAALAPYVDSRDLQEGQPRIWLAGLGGVFASQGRTGIANSTERSAGSLVGATYRLSDQASATFGLGYHGGTVESTGATATINTLLATIGGRYGFSSLETGPYAVVRADAGWVDYQSERPLGYGLGSAQGNTNGAVLSGMAGLGEVIRLAPLTVTLQAGGRVADETLGSFKESGSELALNVHGLNNTVSSVLADLDVSLDRHSIGTWSITPAVTLGYERILGNSRIESTGTLYGYAVSQSAAYESHDLIKAGLSITAQHDAFFINTRGNVIAGDGTKSTGLGGQLSVGYRF